METLLLHKQEPIPSLRRVYTDMPYELDDIYKRMVAKLPNDRFATMSVLVRAIERSGLTVLVADSSLAVRVHIRNTLMNLDFTKVLDFSDGTKALHALTTQSFDLIVTGLNLSGVGGQELTEHLRQTPKFADTPVPLITTEAAQVRLQALRRVGALAIIDKSFRADEVRAVHGPLFPTA